jgi:hypothetical protein
LEFGDLDYLTEVDIETLGDGFCVCHGNVCIAVPPAKSRGNSTVIRRPVVSRTLRALIAKPSAQAAKN